MTMMRWHLSILTVGIVAPHLVHGQVNSSVPSSPNQLFVGFPRQAPDVTTFETATLRANLQDFFLNSPQLTVFAPSNEAFSSSEHAADWDKYLAEPSWSVHLNHILQHHLIEGQILTTSQLATGLVTNSRLSRFLPDGKNTPLTFTTLLNAFYVTGLAFVNSQVIHADQLADNGVMHTVDQVFWPQVLTETVWEALNEPSQRFSTLLELVETLDVESIFENETITLFAPPDEAFENLPSAINVTEVLLDHIVLGDPLTSSQLLNPGGIFETAAGNRYTTAPMSDGRILVMSMVDDAMTVIVEGDYAVANGIYHVVEDVLLPPLQTVTPTGSPVFISTLPPTTEPSRNDVNCTLDFAVDCTVIRNGMVMPFSCFGGDTDFTPMDEFQIDVVVLVPDDLVGNATVIGVSLTTDMNDVFYFPIDDDLPPILPGEGSEVYQTTTAVTGNVLVEATAIVTPGGAVCIGSLLVE